MHLPKNGHPNYPEGITDDTHFSNEGAKQVAELIAEAIRHSAGLPTLIQHMQPLQQNRI